MKKKLLSGILAAFMAATLLTACGGKEADTAAPAAEPAPAAETTPEEEEAEPEAEVEEVAADTGGEMVDDELFAALQDSYAATVDYYNAVQELYSMEEIAADADIEEVMNQAADVINQMGEITQDTLTAEDALELNSAMEDIVDALSYLVDGMELTDEAAAEIVSDETFATLQENYNALTEAYNAVVEAYNSDEVAADADIENALNEAAAIIEEMGTIQQVDITEADAEELNGAMLDILEVLGAVVNAMG